MLLQGAGSEKLRSRDSQSVSVRKGPFVTAMLLVHPCSSLSQHSSPLNLRDEDKATMHTRKKPIEAMNIAFEALS